MANKIVLKKSSVSSKVPLATDLDYGELALNYTDEKLYFKNASNVIKSLNVTQSALTIGTGLSGTSYNGSSAVTIAINSTVATLTGTQTLTNKTIAAASNTISGLTNANLSGSAGITNANLANSSLTIGSTSVSLGATATTLAGLTSVTSTTFVGALTGNATTASTWQTARTITIGNTGKSVNGSANVSWSLAEIGAQASGNYLTTDTNQTISSIKTTNNGINGLQVGGLTNTSSFAPDINSFAAQPFSELWHDLFAFLRFYPTTFETSNGTSFSSATLNRELFAQKENQSIQVINGTSILAARWTFSSTAFGSARWLVIGHSWSTPTPNKTVLVESSADSGVTWTTRHQSTYTNIAQNVYHRLDDYAGDNQIRVTITWVSGGTINLSMIRLLTARPGDQGRGKENQLPFTWNGDQDVTIGRDLSANRLTSTVATGTAPLTVTSTTRVNNLNVATAGTADTLATGRTIAITGDLTYTSGSFNGSANVTGTGTLATVNSNVGSFTNASVTVNAKGLVTAVSSGTALVTGVTATSPVLSSGGTAPVISLATGYGDTQNPFASKTANNFLAAPNGSNGAPTFRAIVAADIPTLNQNTTGSAATLTTARTIGGVSFNGSANINLPGVNTTGNQNTTGSAATLTTTRTLWGQNFNGSANVTGALSSVTTVSMSGQLTSTVATGTAPLVVASTTRVANLNVATAGTADTLTTTRTINGVNFNGSANITVEPFVENDNSTDANRYITFVDSSTAGHQRLNEDDNFTYNPATGTVTSVGGFAAPVALMSNNITTSYSIPAGYNAISAGPIAVASGVSITVPAGSVWTIV